MKQQLSEALAAYTAEIPGFALSREDSLFIVAAARLVKRLLPGECPNPMHGRPFSPNAIDVPDHCPDCVDGQVWDEGIVEVVAKIIYDGDRAHLHSGDPFVAWDLVILERHRSPWHKQARAVLSAIAQLAEAGSQ